MPPRNPHHADPSRRNTQMQHSDLGSLHLGRDLDHHPRFAAGFSSLNRCPGRGDAPRAQGTAYDEDARGVGVDVYRGGGNDGL